MGSSLTLELVELIVEGAHGQLYLCCQRALQRHCMGPVGGKRPASFHHHKLQAPTVQR